MMNTLYRKLLVATLIIIAISLIAGALLANLVYMFSTKQKIDQHNIDMALEIAATLERHPYPSSFADYLASIGKLGYQIALVDSQGAMTFYGQPFAKTELPSEALRVLTHHEIYHGMSHFSNELLLFGHFSNELRNTAGVPIELEGETYGLFLRPNNKLLFSDIHMILIWFVVIIAFVSVIGVLAFAKRLIRPIVKLTEATQELTRENFNYPVHIESNDEIGQLARSFQFMQKQLKHNDEARKAFINNVSHDFQSPLMNIQGYTELMKTSEGSWAERLDYLDIINQEAKRLSSLTRQLLLLTSLDQHAYPMKYSDVAIHEQIQDTIRRHQWRLQEQSIEVSYKLPPIVMRGDAELLENVWENLFTNAIKYNLYGGAIWIHIERTRDSILVVFRDSGIGLSQDAASHIFERFYRVDAARQKNGTGLGLSIVQQIIKLHNGTIAVSSEPDKGTAFTLRFPVG
ncbi:sensor histidine kinase [Paenibacillus sp. strain BS8-2]